MPVLLAHVIVDSTHIFRISEGGLKPPKPPPSVRHWKQPVAYYLNRGSTKSNLFVPDCTLLPLCDKGVNNVKSLKLVCYHTEAILQVSGSRYCDSV